MVGRAWQSDEVVARRSRSNPFEIPRFTRNDTPCQIAEPVPNEVRNLAPSLLRPEASGLATVSLLAMTLHLMRLY